MSKETRVVNAIKDLSILNGGNTLVVFHASCIDGIGAAYSAKLFSDAKGFDWRFIHAHYDDNQEFKQVFKAIEKAREDDYEISQVIMVDFSFGPAGMNKLLNYSGINNVIVIDHHAYKETGKSHLVDYKDDNFSLIFDDYKSGAMLSAEFFGQDETVNDLIHWEIIKFIQDRDLWLFKYPESVGVQQYLKTVAKPNSVDSFIECIETPLEEIVSVGLAYHRKIQAQVKSKTDKEYKLGELMIEGRRFKIINATENISELGNEIVDKYNCPAILWFMKNNAQVGFSIRSNDELGAVNTIASLFGGGGHKNSCGFGGSIGLLHALMPTDSTYPLYAMEDLLELRASEKKFKAEQQEITETLEDKRFIVDKDFLDLNNIDPIGRIINGDVLDNLVGELEEKRERYDNLLEDISIHHIEPDETNTVGNFMLTFKILSPIQKLIWLVWLREFDKHDYLTRFFDSIKDLDYLLFNEEDVAKLTFAKFRKLADVFLNEVRTFIDSVKEKYTSFLIEDAAIRSLFGQVQSTSLSYVQFFNIMHEIDLIRMPEVIEEEVDSEEDK